jgi:hypothetical protein
MIALGRPAAEVTVTGNPAFDTLLDPQVIAAGQRLRADHGWGAGERFVILFASSPEPAMHPFTGEPANPGLPRGVEDELRRIVAADQHLELVIRRHPSDEQSVSIGDRITQSPLTDDISAVIHAVDLVVVISSTVGLQAYLAGVPVVSVEGSVFTKDAPYGAYGMATPAADFSALSVALNSVIARLDPARRTAVNGGTLQNATDRISNAILAGLEGGWDVART